MCAAASRCACGAKRCALLPLLHAQPSVRCSQDRAWALISYTDSSEKKSEAPCGASFALSGCARNPTF